MSRRVTAPVLPNTNGLSNVSDVSENERTTQNLYLMVEAQATLWETTSGKNKSKKSQTSP
jgi:hypothetical protein